MFQVNFEGFGALEKGDFKLACETLGLMSASAVRGSMDGYERWLGTEIDAEDVRLSLQRVDEVIQDAARVITFVDMRNSVLRPLVTGAGTPWQFGDAVPFDDVAGAMARTVKFTGKERIQAMTDNLPIAHVGSGMRLYVGRDLVALDRRNKARVIYHELTHKVLGTEDFRYGEADCVEYAKVDSDGACQNADSWSFFAASFLRA